LADFLETMEQGKRSPMAQKLFHSGLAHAAGFPVAVQCIALVLECMKHCNPETREIKTIDDKLIVRLDSVLIGITFRIPIRDHFVNIQKKACSSIF